MHSRGHRGGPHPDAAAAGDERVEAEEVAAGEFSDAGSHGGADARLVWDAGAVPRKRLAGQKGAASGAPKRREWEGEPSAGALRFAPAPAAATASGAAEGGEPVRQGETGAS